MAAILALLTLALSRPAMADTDNYPAKWAGVPIDSVFDDWREYNRECTSWVAWRLHSRNGFEMPFNDNAYNWGPRAKALGYLVDQNPAPGAVAWWSSGHVAWVESVSPDRSKAHVSEYNNPAGSGAFNQRDIAASSPTGYIHFKDISSNLVLGLPGMGSKIAAARNADGRLAVFYIGTNSAIYYRIQNSPGSGGWGPEQYIAANARAIAAATSHDGRIELFYIGGNSALYHRWQPQPNNFNWSPEEYFPSNILAVSVARNGNGELEVIAIGSNNLLYIMQQTSPDSWNGQWRLLPGGAIDIAQTTSADGRNEAFYVGPNYKLYHQWETKPACCWSAEQWFEANIRKVAAVRNADGRLEVFAIGSNAQIYVKGQTSSSGWYDWGLLPAQARYLAAAVNADGRLEIFYVGSNSQVYHRRQTQAGCCWGPEDILPAQVAP